MGLFRDRKRLRNIQRLRYIDIGRKDKVKYVSENLPMNLVLSCCIARFFIDIDVVGVRNRIAVISIITVSVLVKHPIVT